MGLSAEPMAASAGGYWRRPPTPNPSPQERGGELATKGASQALPGKAAFDTRSSIANGRPARSRSNAISWSFGMARAIRYPWP